MSNTSTVGLQPLTYDRLILSTPSRTTFLRAVESCRCELADRRPMNTLGDLERAVLEHLWAPGGGGPAAQLRDALAGRGWALTTVHTVLTRLEQKGFVEHDDARPRRFRARGTREEHVAE